MKHVFVAFDLLSLGEERVTQFPLVSPRKDGKGRLEILETRIMQIYNRSSDLALDLPLVMKKWHPTRELGLLQSEVTALAFDLNSVV